jgi:hypothetical protein
MTQPFCVENPPTLGDEKNTAAIALSVTKRLFVLFKTKRVLNIETGLETMALGMIICSMVGFMEHLNDLL